MILKWLLKFKKKKIFYIFIHIKKLVDKKFLTDLIVTEKNTTEVQNGSENKNEPNGMVLIILYVSL